MASISIESACRTFADGTRALDGVSLGVADGEFLVLVGPSGCGKSTLLRSVAGLETLDSGRVLIGDADVTDRPAAQRDIAMVFQSYALYPQMTVRDNIEFGLKSRRMGASERQERVADVAGLLGLASLLSRRPGELSGGQMQRVAMGRAIARKPQAFLMDEPLSNLDAVEAMTLGERVAVMRAGTIQQCDTPRRLFDRPHNTFVATFIGSPPMNLLKAEKTAAGIRFGRFELALDGEVPKPGGNPSSVLVGLRPGDLAHDRGAPGHWPRIDVVPHAVEEHGHERIVRFRYDASADGGSECAAAALLGGRETVAKGERLRLAVDTAHLHYFDPESGNALS
jgi:multiple sugar transport system ATP-binding protein